MIFYGLLCFKSLNIVSAQLYARHGKTPGSLSLCIGGGDVFAAVCWCYARCLRGSQPYGQRFQIVLAQWQGLRQLVQAHGARVLLQHL